MQVLQRLISVITAVALAVAFTGFGLMVCLMPPITHSLANSVAQDDVSPFDRTQLVKVADATRDFSFGSHSELSLLQTIYGIDKEYKQKVEAAKGTLPDDFPKMDVVTDEGDLNQLKYAFSRASEMYCYSSNTVSHLDDCHAIITVAVPVLIACAILAIGGLAVCGFYGKRRQVGGVLMAAGIVVFVSFVALGLWAAIDFNGFFTAFHQMFFSQGNWEFPYDSLLICALPTAFWMGMGVVWFVTTAIVSILSFVIGKRLRK